MSRLTRRRLLGALGSTAAIATAGCGGDGGGDGDGTTTAADTTTVATTADTTAATTTAATTTAATTTAGGQPAVVMSTVHPEHGTILVDGEGMTLYRFAQDEPGTSTCTGGCAESWPPLTTAGEPTGTGLLGDLGTIQREDGTAQVTYEGWPLYYFQDDTSPGDAAGQGANDVWFVVPPDVEPIGSGAGTTTETRATTTDSTTTTAEPTATTTEASTTTTQASLPSQVSVDLANSAFDPVQAEVAVGGTVEWTNQDGFSHDVTSDQFSDGAESWSKATSLSGGQSTSHTFDSAGFYEYYCTIHGESTMCGVVVVGEDTEYTGSLPCAS